MLTPTITYNPTSMIKKTFFLVTWIVISAYAQFDTLLVVPKDRMEYKILWKDYLGKTQVNYSLINQLSEPEKAILAYYSVRAGSDCKERNGRIYCKLSDALLLDQCSPEHKKFIYKWFEGEKEITEDIGKCFYKTPDNPKYQEFYYISIFPTRDSTEVYYVRYKIRGRNASTGIYWHIDGLGKFYIRRNHVELIREEEVLSYEK